MSLPNQKACDGGRKRRVGASACGSTVPSHGASRAASTMAARSAPPSTATRWRRTNRKSANFREGASTSEVAMEAMLLFLVPDARVQERIGQINDEID